MSGDSNAARSAIMRAIRLYGGVAAAWARDNYGEAVEAMLAEGLIKLNKRGDAYQRASSAAR